MVRKGVEVVLTALYVAVLAAVLGGIGAAVRHSGPVLDVEPEFARRVAEGLRVLWLVGDENAKRTERLLDELTPPPVPAPPTPRANTRA